MDDLPRPSPAIILFCEGLPGAAARDCHKAYVPTVAKVAEPTMRHDVQSSYFGLEPLLAGCGGFMDWLNKLSLGISRRDYCYHWHDRLGHTTVQVIQ